MFWSPSSLRIRLLLWYSSLLGLVIALFACVLGYFFWRSTMNEVDRSLDVQASAIVEGVRLLPGGGIEFDRPEEFRQADRLGADGPVYYGLWNAAGELVERYPADAPIEGAADLAVVDRAGRTRDGRREISRQAPGGVRVVVGRDVADVRAALLRFAGMAALAGGLALLISVIGGWLVVGRALKPIAGISRTATAMIDGDLAARVSVGRAGSELGQLAAALNGAFDRLCGVMERQQQFAADASHELRTPLATVTTETEWALATERSPTEYAGALLACRRAAARMSLVVDRLLASARGGVAVVEPRRVDVDFHEVVGDVVEMMRPVAEKRGIAITTRLASASVVGDQDRLTDAVINLVANAVEYTQDGGSVEVEVTGSAETACLLVRDTGTGIPREDLPFIFERFYRADRARTGTGGGIGLGLSIAKDVIEAHGGRIECVSTVGQGTEFTILLPCRG
jgi:two-component system OmpR family sensor kinase